MDHEQLEPMLDQSEGTAPSEQPDPVPPEPMGEKPEELIPASEPASILSDGAVEDEQPAPTEQPPVEELPICEEQGPSEQPAPERIPQWNTQQPPRWGAQPPQWGTQRPPYEGEPSYRDGYYSNGPYAEPRKAAQPWIPYRQMPPQPAYYAPPMPKEEKNVGSIFALVCSLVGILLVSFMPFFAVILGIASICSGWMGLKRSKEIGKGKVCSVIGVVLGCVELVVSVAMIAMMMTLVFRAFEMLGDVFKEFPN